MRYALSAVLAICGLSGAMAAGDLVIIADGQPKACIITGRSPSDAAKGAAAELAAYLKRLTGAELPVLEQAADRKTTRILVGYDAARHEAGRLKLKLPSGQTHLFAEEAYLIYADSEMMMLVGNETEPYEGTWYAVYDYLETLGCRWYFPGEFGEVVPQLRTITVPQQKRLVKPDLRVRDTWYSGHLAVHGEQSAEFSTWKRRNRMTRYGFWLHCADENARYLQNPVDDSTWRLLPKEKHFEAHPEYYALRSDGTRNDRFPCLSNPAALEAAVSTVCEYFAAHPNHNTFAFSPPDEPVLCHCPDCTRAMNGGFSSEGWGDVSDPYFRFVFALADKVRERYPDRWITSMAYYNRCRPPQGVKGKHPNVLIQLASIQQCSLHSYTQEGCWTRRQFGEMLRQWAELTAGQVFYEYDPHDWTHLQRPCWRSQSEAEDLRLLKELGGWGFSDEGQMAWMSTGLNYWVRARLAWDVTQDTDEMVRDFCARFFGPADGPMCRLYSSIEKAIRETEAHSGGFPGRDDWQIILPRTLLDDCDGWLKEATGSATQEPYRTRVNAFRAYFDRVNAYVRMREAMNRADFTEAARQADVMVDTVSRMGNAALLQDAGPWGGSRSGVGLGKVARELAKWTDGTKGKLVVALPQVASFRADPAGDGVVGRWYREDPGGEWQDLSMTSAWESQGVLTPEGRSYSGAAWYRVNVDLAALPEAPVRLLIPELAGSGVWVWCNGQFAGYTAKDRDNPMSVGLGDLPVQGSNRFVLRVVGNGGLCLPPCIIMPTDDTAFPDRLVELSVFPSQWLFRKDPQQVGDAEGWAKPDAGADGWTPIAVPAAWEKAGAGDYDGVAWYRVRFTIPQTAEGKRLLLRFGAVDEEAWVYLNGELLGEHTEKSTGETVHQIWDKPFSFELSNAPVGRESVLVVKVKDSTMAGGIFEPVRLYQVP